MVKNAVSLGIGINGALVVMAILFLIGVGMVFAFGAIILLSPLTAGVFIVLLFMVLTFFMGGEKRTMIATFCLFVILALLFGRYIQSTFEMISSIFKAIEVIL